jgi:TolB-like protein/Tfp pilus assembly protein PilF
MTGSEGPGAAAPSPDSRPAVGPSGAPPAAFVSYASADRAVAEALTAYLEQRGIRCWIAPRDVPPGALYADAIVRAINEAPALLLLLSHNSIESSHVGKEVERASSKKKRIIAVRLDAAPLTPGFEYFLSESQWVDVAADGREAAFAKLAGALANPASPLAAASLSRPPPPPRPGWRSWPVAVSVLAIAVLALAGTWLLRAAHTAAPAAAAAPNDKSIAVLPFVDMSEAHDQEYFADGMSEQILDLLAKIPTLKVIARTSSFQFKGKAEDVRVVGEKLGVATVLEGSVRKAGDRLRITAQLIRASDGTHLWSEVYDRQVRDIFRTQDEIADAVVAALKVSLLGAAPRPVPTANTEAYALYLQGLAYAQRYTTPDSVKSRELFRRALVLDPNFALAWAALAGAEGDVLVFGSGSTRGQSASFDTIRGNIARAANRAIELDPKLADAHVALANIGFLDYDFVSSQREVRTALELEPDNPNALGTSIYLSIGSCRLEDAARFARRLIERDPLSVDPYRGLATALWFDGHAAEAEAVYRRLFAFRPEADSMHARLSLILLSEGRAQDALTELDAETTPGWQAVGRAMAFDALGRRAEADKLLAQLQTDYSGFQYQVAQIYAHRRDREHALLWLDRARQDHDPGYINYLKCDPMLSDLRADPRYQSMLAQLNLPP